MSTKNAKTISMITPR